MQFMFVLCLVMFYRRCAGYRRLLPPRGLCCLPITVIALNLLCLYLLHTSPPAGCTRTGLSSPQARGGLAAGAAGWDSLGNVLCGGPLRWVKDPASRQTTALASAPGSGNTWLRHLLQQATGLMTGSQYNDAFLARAGFPGEGVSNGSVLVVKTHEAREDVRQQFHSAVLLLRHPRHSVLAEFNRLHGGHLGQASSKDFEKHWSSYAAEGAAQWLKFNTEWLMFTGPLHIVRYEDLQHNLNDTFSSLLQFLKVTVKPQDLDCALQYTGQAFRRRKSANWKDWASHTDIFSESVLQLFEDSERQFTSAFKPIFGGSSGEDCFVMVFHSSPCCDVPSVKCCAMLGMLQGQ